MSDDLVKRLRKVEPDAPGERTRWYRNPDGPEAADRIEALEAAIKTQANAVLAMRNCEETEINLLRKTHMKAYIAAQTLDSERTANAILTDRIEHLEKMLETVMRSAGYSDHVIRAVLEGRSDDT